jgi:PIN domain nuclease of toxin-antitoxin system
MKVEPILPSHAKTIATLPRHHKDPFDRMLAAQSLAAPFTLVSSDPIFDQYGVSRLW